MKAQIPKLIIIKLTIALFLFIFVGLYLYVNNPQTNTLKINEVSFENELGYDWVELYNPTLQTMSLKGLFLTDDKTDLEKFEIKDDVLIEPNSYVVIYSENYNPSTTSVNSGQASSLQNGGQAGQAGDGEVIELNFNIKNGESVYLIEKRSLTIIDSLTVLSDEENMAVGSVGRFPNGADETFIFSIASMGGPNIKDHIHGPGIGIKSNPAIR